MNCAHQVLQAAATGADDLQLVLGQPFSVQSVGFGRVSDHGEASSGAKAVHPGRQGLLHSDAVDHAVSPLTLGKFPDGLLDVPPGGVDGEIGAHPDGEIGLFRDPVYGQDSGAGQFGDLNGRDAHAPGSEDDDAVVQSHPGPVHGVQGRDASIGQHGCFRPCDVVGQRDQLARRNGQVFGVAAPVLGSQDPRHVGTELFAAGPAHAAAAAGGEVVDHHPVARFHPGDPLSHLGDHAGDLVAQDGGEFGAVAESVHNFQVGAIGAAGHHLNQGFFGPERGLRPLLDLQRLAQLFENGGFHHFPP